MKKIFSLLALACAFVACVPETIKTVYVSDPAKAEITVNVTGFEGQKMIVLDYGKDYTLSVSAPSNLKVEATSPTIIVAPASGYSIPKSEISITVTSVADPSVKSTVVYKLNPVPADSQHKGNIDCILGQPEVVVPPTPQEPDPVLPAINDDETLKVFEVDSIIEEETTFIKINNKEFTSLDLADLIKDLFGENIDSDITEGIALYKNETDNEVQITFSYPTKTGFEVTYKHIEEGETFDEVLIDAFNNPGTSKVDDQAMVDPHSYFCVTLNTTTILKKYEWWVIKESDSSQVRKVSSFDLTSYMYGHTFLSVQDPEYIDPHDIHDEPVNPHEEPGNPHDDHDDHDGHDGNEGGFNGGGGDGQAE